ncbi:TrmB family transcriptional regulator [Halobacterium sp. CBA1126]|uniref:TrmB family transcriptional regulator n=1 Tax=Halobacterium sp. CBA1126 TaxID=2668074 RepID=UPI0012F81476|nr:helix-turn-helix domain-containing protein [Halobacterium sp. CBA1126]MUV61187.1 TrmB family transcriptional regulator [Halobacterium sp. CBA1126]
MSFDTPEEARDVAIERLEQFGLSTYAARTFVALAGLGTGTAKDVSRVADVPRTRVYDAVDELQSHGLVDVQQSTPKEFWAISAATTGRKVEREWQYRADELQAALDELQPVEQSEEQRGVWTVSGRKTVTERVVEFCENAEDRIVYMTVEELLTGDVVDALEAAADRGVTIELAGVSPDVQERIQEGVPSADLFESLWMWSDTPAGRLMMVDGDTTLVSVLVDGENGQPTTPESETAIWGSGETNSLVVVLRAIFTWRLDDD